MEGYSFFRGLRFKIIFSLVVIISVLFTGFYYFLTQIRRDQLIRNFVESSTTDLAAVIEGSLRRAMLTRDLNAIHSIMGAVRDQQNVLSVFLVNKNGEVLVDPDVESPRTFLISDPTCQGCHDADSRESRVTIYLSDEDGMKIARNVSPIFNDPECHGCHDAGKSVLGMVVADLSLSEVEARLNGELRHRLVSLAFLLFLVVIGLSVSLDRLVLTRLKRCVSAAQRFGRGELDQKIPEESCDEMGELAAVLNRMSTDLGENIKECRRTERQLFESQKRLEATGRIGLMAGATLNLDEVLHRILEGTLRATQATTGTIFLASPGSDWLELRSFVGLSKEFEKTYREHPVRLGKGLTGKIALTGESIYIERGACDDPRITRPEVIAEGWNSFIGVPILAEGDVVAVMNIVTRNPELLDRQDLNLVSAVGTYVGSAIRNAHLYEQRRLAEVEIARSRDYLNSITDAIDDGIIVIEEDYTISFVNEAYSSQVGMGIEEISGNSCYRVSHGRDTPCQPPEHTCPLKTVFATRLPQVTIHRHVDQNGTPMWVEVSCSPLLDPHGKVFRVVEVTRDITERKRMENEFFRAEQLAALGQMASTVAHEIRNPLAGIRGALEIIQGQKVSKAHADVLRQVLEEIDRVSKTTKRLLDFARPAAPRPRISDLNDIIEKVYFLANEQARTQGMKVIKDLEPNGQMIRLDPELTSQAFLNIALNALQAMDKGGILTITSRWFQAEGMVRVSFVDTGKGMTREVLSRIFNPFFTTKRYGTGLGLYVVHESVESQGGTVEVASTPGKGTTFVVTFPVSEYDTGSI